MPPHFLGDLVADYRNRFEPALNSELAFYSEQPLDRLIRHAALAITPQGKRHPHQRRLARGVLQSVHDALLMRYADIRRARTFEELHTLVARCSVPGFGALAVYDTALRLGAGRGLMPGRVHLHRGALKGAIRLMGAQVREGSATDLTELPPEVQALGAAHAENFLCIYKDRINTPGGKA